MPRYRVSSMSSSPPSSPSLCVDSSPASSPPLEPMDLDEPSPPPMQLAHPFAASVKANRAPPDRDLGRLLSPKSSTKRVLRRSRLEPPTKKFRSDKEDPIDLRWEDDVPEPLVSPSYAYQDPEMAIWDEALTKVVDSGSGVISLSNKNLTYIPKRISDLRNFVAIPETFERVNAGRLAAAALVSGGRLFTRVTTAPARTSGALFTRSTVLDRTKSIEEASIGLAREELQLFLTSNQISRLPRELFDLQKLTVLILRANQLTYIPPEIVRLSNLRELNVSNNKLQYLPSEMSNMKLTQLHLHPNPFISWADTSDPDPNHDPTVFGNASSQPFTVSRVSRSIPCLPPVIPLAELALRVLVSHHIFPELVPVPAEDSSPLVDANDTVLAVRYPLPLEEWDIPPPLRSVLEDCVPDTATRWRTENPSDLEAATGRPFTGVGVCPSPYHNCRSVFVHHAEEVYTWGNRIASVDVGGWVPLRWRGCRKGCLDFLHADMERDEERKAEVGEGGDDSEVVQLLNLSLAGDFDEFD